MELNKLQQDVGFLPLLSTEQDVLIQTYITKTMEGLSRLLIGGENASNQHEEEKEVESNKHQSPVESIIEEKTESYQPSSQEKHPIEIDFPFFKNKLKRAEKPIKGYYSTFFVSGEFLLQYYERNFVCATTLQ